MVFSRGQWLSVIVFIVCLVLAILIVADVAVPGSALLFLALIGALALSHLIP